MSSFPCPICKTITGVQHTEEFDHAKDAVPRVRVCPHCTKKIRTLEITEDNYREKSLAQAKIIELKKNPEGRDLLRLRKATELLLRLQNSFTQLTRSNSNHNAKVLMQDLEDFLSEKR